MCFPCCYGIVDTAKIPTTSDWLKTQENLKKNTFVSTPRNMNPFERFQVSLPISCHSMYYLSFLWNGPRLIHCYSKSPPPLLPLLLLPIMYAPIIHEQICKHVNWVFENYLEIFTSTLLRKCEQFEGV